MGSTVPLQHHPPHPGPPVIIDVDQIPDHVRAVPVTSLPNSLLVANIPVAAPTYIQPHQPQVSTVESLVSWTCDFRRRSSATEFFYAVKALHLLGMRQVLFVESG